MKPTLLLALALGLSACTYQRGAKNDPPSLCTPPRQAEAAWHSVFWSIRAAGDSMGYVPNASVAGRTLAGTWDVLQVATEGVMKNPVERWQLRLVATDSAVRHLCWYGQPCPGAASIPAAGARIGAGALFDSVAAARRVSKDTTEATVHFSESLNKLSLSFGPPMIDGEATLYDITEVTDSTLMGRWAYGGIRRFDVKRGDVVTRELPQGFFCARRAQ